MAPVFPRGLRPFHLDTRGRELGHKGSNRESGTRSAFMIVQETGDPLLQQGGVARFIQGRVLEEPALNASRQIIPFADESGTRTFQNSALHVPQIAGQVKATPRPALRLPRPNGRERLPFLLPMLGFD